MAIKVYDRGSDKRLSNNFRAKEFECKCGKCAYTLIDELLITYLQRIRNHFGAPVIINSGYRCDKHNKKVGGSAKSKHKEGRAADIVVRGIKPIEVSRYAETIGIRGIGLYDTFTHIDTRANKSFWYSSNEEYRKTFK